MNRILSAAIALTPALALAGTQLLAPNIYGVRKGVDFTMANQGAQNFLFNWSDSGGTFASVPDPTLVLIAGETYTFMRTTANHPFRITDDTLPVTGTDGSYARTTNDGTVIDAATLTPIEDFTADPAPTTDKITWTPTVGDYFYTCRVLNHTVMTGRIEVLPPCPGDATFDSAVNFSDLNAILSSFGQSGAGLPGDVDCDGDVDFTDLNETLASFGADCAGGAKK